MRLKILILGIFLLVGLCVQGEEIVKIIAKVNNHGITSADLDEYCKLFVYRLSDSGQASSCEDTQLKKEALVRVIEDKLILDKAKRENINIPLANINDKFDKIVSAYPSREKFEESLIARGMTITRLKEKIKEQFLMREILNIYVRSFVSVSPHEISSYYAENKGEFYASFEYSFYVFRSSDQNFVEEILKAIENDGILAVEKKYKSSIIKMESNRDQLRQELVEVLDGLEEKKQQIVQLDDIYNLIYLNKKATPKVLSLDEVKENIHAYLEQRKFARRFGEWVGELKERAVIKNYYE